MLRSYNSRPEIDIKRQKAKDTAITALLLQCAIKADYRRSSTSKNHAVGHIVEESIGRTYGSTLGASINSAEITASLGQF